MTAPTVTMTPRLAAMLSAQERVALKIELPSETAERVKAGEEKELQRQAESYLRARDIQWVFHEQNSRGNKHGTPDLVFGYRPKGSKWAILCGVELKAGKNKTTDDQEKTLERMEFDGAATAVCRSVAELKSFLDGLA